jgi:hypothetical protein
MDVSLRTAVFPIELFAAMLRQVALTLWNLATNVHEEREH